MVISCERCGKSFERRGARAAKARFCSMTCRRVEERACKVCGVMFRPQTETRGGSYCSVKCKGVDFRVTFTCEECGVESYGFRNINKRWCSRRCALVHRRTGTERACVRCGTAFYITKSRVDIGEGKFCSLACHNLDQGRGKTDHVCKICGAGFRWSPSRTKPGSPPILYCSIPCRDADPERRAQLLRMSASLQLGKPTSAELRGYALLDDLGLEYVRQPTFGGKFTPDAAIPSARLVVQFDGDYWHDRKGTSTEPRILRRVAADHSQDRYIRACGWEVVRLWATDLARDPDGCLEKVSQLAHRPLPAAPARDPLARASGRTGAAAP